MSSLNRRSFLTKTAAGAGSAIGITMLPAFSPSRKQAWQCIHNTNAMQTLISMQGIEKPLTILQIADTHISCDNDSDREYEQYSARMNKAFLQTKHYKTGQSTTTVECFKELMQLAIQEKVDMIALVGDIVNYPSATAVEFVRSQVVATGIPYIYAAGNHDWHYEGMSGSSDQLRHDWCNKTLKPLYNSGNPFCSSTIVSGINMVMIDNSTYQVNEEQLAFYKQQSKKPEPLALFVHIPLYINSMRMSCGHPDWGAATDKNYEIERREKWSASGNKKSTSEFLQQVKDTEKLAGVFAGHWHQYYSISHQHIHQHLALPGFNGQHRLIKFEPLG